MQINDVVHRLMYNDNVDSSEDSAITLSRKNFSRYVGHVTMVSQMLTNACWLALQLGFNF